MPGPKLIPYGELEGRTIVEVDVGAVDLDDEGALTTAILRARVPGAAAVELVHAPWGTPDLDRALMLVAADARTENVELWACRSVHETRWAAHPMWWCLDASPLFAAQTTALGLVNAINSLPFLPPPAELLVVNPHPQSISGALLDELHTRLDPGCSWIYLDRASPAWVVAEREIARANTAWGLRVLQPSATNETKADDDAPQIDKPREA